MAEISRRNYWTKEPRNLNSASKARAVFIDSDHPFNNSAAPTLHETASQAGGSEGYQEEANLFAFQNCGRPITDNGRIIPGHIGGGGMAQDFNLVRPKLASCP